jgi:aminoglycoside phosphotransferase family enzyme/predicted kinase
MRPGLELRQTHISWVFLSETDVWKVKKPVALGFLDFATLQKRLSACEAEVRLNRRLAPDVYRGVVSVRRAGDGQLQFGGEGELVDWAVHMRRLPDEDRADNQLSAGHLTGEDIEAIAVRVARFHEECQSDQKSSRFGAVDVIRKNVHENFEQVRATITDYVSPDQAREIETWQEELLRDREPTFEARVRQGRIRDGHGDLRLEHVYLDRTGDVVIIDCIEFNERFRYGDVCADVVFLATDLARAARVDLAERLLALYAREANDYDLYALVDFYESYRAFVRGKISAMMASMRSVSFEAREHARGEARRYFLLALASERRPLLPSALIAVGGVIASGKSTIASRLGAELAVPVVDADRTRKSLAGVGATSPVKEGPWRGVYSEEFGDRTYIELLRRARCVLTTRRSVIVDASFRASRHRDAVRSLAREIGIPFAFVECRADAETCRERLRNRKRGVSDGRLEIFDDFVRTWEPVTELSAAEHIVVDTTFPIDQTMHVLRERLPVSFARITH